MSQWQPPPGQGGPWGPPPQPYPPQPYPAPPPGWAHVAGYLVRLASWGPRVGAHLIDQLLSAAPLLVGYGIMIAAFVASSGRTGEPEGVGAVVGVVAALLGWAGSLAVAIWNRFLRQGRTGQSVGKSALGLVLVGNRTGAPIGAGMAFVRDLAHVVDGIAYIGYLWPLWDPRRQTFADMICGTLVTRP